MQPGTDAPKLSIVVPVYKVEAFLPRCLDSLLAQTFRDFEIILVNDGSPDGSLAICEDYARRDPRIRVFSKENGGLSDARNYGMTYARGELLTFLDSDDYVESENHYAYLISKMEETGAEIAVAGIKLFTGESDVYDVRCVSPEVLCDRHDAIRELLVSARITNSVWNKVYRRAMFDGIQFPLGKLYEDGYVIYDVFNRADHVFMTDAVFNMYRQHPASITHYAFSPREMDRVQSSVNKIAFTQQYFPDLEHLAEQYLVYDCMTVLSKMKQYDPQYTPQLRAYLRRYLPAYLRGDHSLHAKLYAALAALSPRLMIFLQNALHIPPRSI